MAMAVIPKTVQIYTTASGYQPFADWLDNLKNIGDRQRILMRLRRIESGNLGDYKHISDGVYELRLFFASGYRVYFGNDGEKIIIILCAGNKATQGKGIASAINHWRKYNEKSNSGCDYFFNFSSICFGIEL